MCRHPRLWRFAVIPVILNLLITALVLGLLIAGVIYFVVTIHPRFSGGWGSRVIEFGVAVAALAAAVGVALGAWVLLNGILCGHYYGKLAREVELQLGMRPEDITDIPIRAQIVDTLRDVGSLLVVNVGLLALHFIPVIGSVAAVVLTLYFDWMIFGRDFLDFPLSLRGWRRADKRAFTHRHRPHTLGVGAAVFLFNFVPVVGSVVQSTAVAGAVLLHRRLVDAVPAAR
jgi:CysZ protein